MTPALNDERASPTISPTASAAITTMTASQSPPTARDQVSFSHVQLYVDYVESLEVYKELEANLNTFHEKIGFQSTLDPPSHSEKLAIWKSLTGGDAAEQPNFIPQNRDVIKQLMVGFGFRVTGYRLPGENTRTTTKSYLVTSKDRSGVQLVVSAIADAETKVPHSSDEYCHLDVADLREFFNCHSNRQGIAVLGFRVTCAERIHERYQTLHPNLIHSFRRYEDSKGVCTKVLQVYAYYSKHTISMADDQSNPAKWPDTGTLLRFVEVDGDTDKFCILPGLTEVDAVFDSVSQPAYCDHWVSNVFSRTEFLSTLEDTLGFTPKVDFNAGVVAAGEAQIESTVTGNSSIFEAADKAEALKDQSQVFLPINNALSKVGHVHGFLEEIGQGIQHVASRVDNLVEFVDRCNWIRESTGEGFTFLKIPRSYYGILTTDYLASTAGIPEDLAARIFEICEQKNIVSLDGAVNLDLDEDQLYSVLMSEAIDWEAGHRKALEEKKDEIISAILTSRYRNLFSLLRHHVPESTYMGIVRNEILVDVQGDDILYQIFTCNILQRNAADEAPFLEFIQRVCSDCKDEVGCQVKIKPGCGGFGIRNFLTLFLSIEVSKAMREAAEAKRVGDNAKSALAQRQVDCFTRQLNDSNPILTLISDAMTEEGRCKEQMEAALQSGDDSAAVEWMTKMQEACQLKEERNAKLMACSAQYEAMMRSIREAGAKD